MIALALVAALLLSLAAFCYLNAPSCFPRLSSGPGTNLLDSASIAKVLRDQRKRNDGRICLICGETSCECQEATC